jgi:hypothetical protein
MRRLIWRLEIQLPEGSIWPPAPGSDMLRPLGAAGATGVGLGVAGGGVPAAIVLAAMPNSTVSVTRVAIALRVWRLTTSFPLNVLK